MNLQEANFQDLLTAYYKGTNAAKAAEYLLSEIKHSHHKQLAILLRDYRTRSIDSDREIRLRAATDDLMICCDVLEIAALAGFIAPPGQSDFWKTIEAILEDLDVQKYYAKFYPLKLPQMLRYRIQSRHRKVEKESPELPSLVMQFLELDQRFMATLNDGYLLRLLDSFTIDGYWFSDIVGLVGKPQEFIRRILLPPEKRGVQDQTLHELSFFMEFSFDLSQLLDRLASLPLLRSEVWNHYSYWFGIIGEELKSQLGSALNQFLKWKPDGKDRTAATEIQSYVAQATNVIASLTSPDYAVCVDDQLRKLSLS